VETVAVTETSNSLSMGKTQRIAPAPQRNERTAVAFHWIVAALIVFLGALGLPLR
jgi:hypothetical protein